MKKKDDDVEESSASKSTATMVITPDELERVVAQQRKTLAAQFARQQEAARLEQQRLLQSTQIAHQQELAEAQDRARRFHITHMQSVTGPPQGPSIMPPKKRSGPPPPPPAKNAGAQARATASSRWGTIPSAPMLHKQPPPGARVPLWAHPEMGRPFVPPVLQSYDSGRDPRLAVMAPSARSAPMTYAIDGGEAGELAELPGTLDESRWAAE